VIWLISPKKSLLKRTPFFNNVFPPEVVTYVSCCPHDFSLPADRNDLTQEQRKFLSEQLDLTVDSTVNIRQVHGDKIISVLETDVDAAPEVLEEADGIITGAVDLPIMIRTADCVPIFVYDLSQKRMGLFHAGREGTKKKILLKGLESMNARPENVKIAFGPAIRGCCYEVREGILEDFPNDLIQRGERYYVDLVKVNRTQALEYGIQEDHMEDCGICTCCDEHYFSYRRNGKNAGRNISLMMLRKES